jgi:4-amino-4-deoxy-L-arabinose transferase-like glycosyltransferase
LALGKQVLIGILVLTATLRTVHLVAHLSSGLNEPESVMTESDMYAFTEWATRIRGGDLLSADTYHPYPDWMAAVAPLESFERWWGGREVFHQTPLYAYLLALSYLLSGGKVLLLLLQVAASTLGVYLIYRIGGRIGGERAGLLAASLAAVYAPSIVFDAVLLRASLTASLTVTSIWLLTRVRDTGLARVALGTGVVLAAGFLLRPGGLALMASPLVLLLDSKARPEWRRWLPALAVGVAIGLAPVVVRNVAVGAPALSFSNRGVEAMIQGNHRGADPAVMMLPSSADYRRIMEESDGSVPRALLGSVRTWPEDGRLGWWAWHEGRKLLAMFRDHEYANNVNFYFYRRATPLLELLPTFGWICGLGVLGVVLIAIRGRDRTVALLLTLAAGGLIGIMLISLATGRYRLPLATLMTIPAGFTLAELWGWTAERRRGPALACAAAVVVLSACSFGFVPTRVVFDQSLQPRYIRGADARLYERLAALRPFEFTEETLMRSTRGDTASAGEVLSGYLAEVHRTLRDAPPPEDLSLRRRVVNQTHGQLTWARDQFAVAGLGNFARSVDLELEWIRATQ